MIRPLVLFADRTAAQRAEETHTHPETVRNFPRRFRQQGMLGLLPEPRRSSPQAGASRSLRQCVEEMARLKALYNGFQYREIARIIFYKVQLAHDDKTVKRLWQQSQPVQEELALGDYHSQATAIRRASKSSSSIIKAGQAQYQSHLPRLPPDDRSVDSPL